MEECIQRGEKRNKRKQTKSHKVFVDLLGADLLEHATLKHFGNGGSLLLVHGGLIRNTDPGEHGIRVEALRRGVLELFHKFSLVATVENIVDDIVGLLEVEHHDVVLCHGGGGDGLLVLELAVEDSGHVLLAVRVHSVPDLGNPWACRVDNAHVLLL